MTEMSKKIFAVSAIAVVFGLLLLPNAYAAWDVSSYTGPDATDTLAFANGAMGIVWDNIEAVLPNLVKFAVVMALIFAALYFVLKRLHIIR